jgi:hypothetical protein
VSGAQDKAKFCVEIARLMLPDDEPHSEAVEDQATAMYRLTDDELAAVHARLLAEVQP